MINFIIEEAREENIEEILKINSIVWKDTYINSENNITLEDINLHTSITKERMNKYKEYLKKVDYKCFIAKVDCKIVGYTWPRVINEKNQVGAIYILPEFQGQGIGKALIEKVVKFFKDKPVYIECATYNHKAIEFYKKNGFVVSNGSKELFHKLDKTGKAIPLVEMKKDND